MPSRHRSRQRALQLLFQMDLNRQDPFDAIDDFYETLHTSEDDVRNQPENPEPPPRDEFMEQLVRGASSQRDEIDARIRAHSEHWRLERMAAVDRNILRLAIYEMCYLETPAAIVIDEALELARRFSTDESIAFINGVLDAVHREMEPSSKAAGAGESEST
ncbi:MAG: transcription antitermination factor NusB [Bryobacteraceae bacterium]|nr:transcription antitermination factor NusB [Bryobacteraceae bacterium]MDW8377566.1 transcription antitermination factor NusB [Bryobacterales bacterium]